MSDLCFCMVLRSLPSQSKVKTQVQIDDIIWNMEIQFLHFKSIINLNFSLLQCHKFFMFEESKIWQSILIPFSYSHFVSSASVYYYGCGSDFLEGFSEPTNLFSPQKCWVVTTLKSNFHPCEDIGGG